MAPAPVVQWGSTPEALDDVVQVLALCPSVLPMLFSSFVPDDAVQRWLDSALPLAIALGVSETLTAPVSPAGLPVLAQAAPVGKKTRRSAKATDKNPRRRSPKTAAATAALYRTHLRS
jgi:hypothetical protein